jgi:hypothetical protein
MRQGTENRTPKETTMTAKNDDAPQPHGEGVFHVNEREGRVAAHGEDLTGREILDRVGLSADRYELFTIEHGKTGPEVKPDQTIRVKPGDHFRATLRDTNYS